jgi:hypothetical protein
MTISVMSGCDGHIARLNIRERPPTGHESIRGRVLQICAGQDVPGTVRAVAESLSLKEDDRRYAPASTQSYSWSDARGRYVLDLDRVTDDTWTVMMLDWPMTARSPASRETEKRIRQRLKTDCTRP